MSGGRKTYDKKFKLMSVELSSKRTDLGALAKELDISQVLLYRWRREYLAKANSSFPGNGKTVLNEAEQEVARLKKELRDTQLERDILKSLYSVGTVE